MLNPIEHDIMSKVPTVKMFFEFVQELDDLCKKYGTTYETVQVTAKLLDDFGWEHHPEKILALTEEAHRSEQTPKGAEDHS